MASTDLSDFVNSKKASSSFTNLLASSGANNLGQGLKDKWSGFMSKGTKQDADAVKSELNGESMNGWFDQAKADPCLPSLTKKQRILGFMLCLALAVFCFFMSSLYIPVLVFKARKFALLYSMGSMFFILSFAALWGPVHHFKHLFSGNRLPFTIVYFFTIGATLYFSMWKRSYFMTILCAVIQILAMVWYIISYIPGGQTGLKFFYKVFYAFTARTASTVLPV